MDFSFLKEFYPYFISGTIITLIISVITVILDHHWCGIHFDGYQNQAITLVC